MLNNYLMLYMREVAKSSLKQIFINKRMLNIVQG
jgi:hypothetical protein